ncbi:hypothetical protein SO802_026467 [Lithocarpus litseifolius]|uniref:RNase H type-1 domain-containing protein n=1 Tax=Lithocarpus litseifolius TaxID=425828 RepID=A0AAW2C051_9ROSI
MDEDPTVLMLREEGAYWQLPAIVEATIELKNWAWEGVAHPMEDSMKKIKTVKSVTLAKKIKTKSMKGRAIANHLAHCSPEETEEIHGDFLDEDIMRIEVESWKMYFDGATNQNGSGIGVLLISPKGTHIPFFGGLNFPTTNNVTEYEACIIGLQGALGLGVKELKVYVDSTLIIS